MKLDRVEIKNFRSIGKATIDFSPPCRVLVGINESGKSNIIEALSLLSGDFAPEKNADLREALPDEDPITDSHVRFVFKFDKNQSDALFAQVSAQVLATKHNPSIAKLDGTPLTLKKLCARRNEGLYVADILEETKTVRYWSLVSNYKLLAGWKKPSDDCPPDYIVSCRNKDHVLAECQLINGPDFPDIPGNYLEDASLGDLSSLVGNHVVTITEENLPAVLRWEFDERNLLPGSVNIITFAANPDSCIPLRNMFTLAGIENIKDSIAKAREGTANQFQNYLDRVARKTTRHFRDVWKEHKTIEFSLKLNADQIIPGVKEINTHDFARRSDGFKRFVTFLLLISVNVKTKRLQNTLVLIDEPDANLHPSGARYLRDELIRISTGNYVVYSTHSIFMIDSGDISRHYIVSKNKEVTSIEVARESNVADEEVLYNALGHSLFSILKAKNIIFEGWRDKRLFQVMLPAAAASMKQKYKHVGICHAKGAKSIRAITPLIELAKRECLIVSDSDKPAREQQKIYLEQRAFGKWTTYQEIDSSIEAVTGEDFVKNGFIAKQINEIISGNGMPAFDQAALPDKSGKVEAIAKWLRDQGMTPDQTKNMTSRIKDAIFENLTDRHVEDTYAKLLRGITF